MPLPTTGSLHMLFPGPEMLFLALITQATSEPTSHLLCIYLLTAVGFLSLSLPTLFMFSPHPSPRLCSTDQSYNFILFMLFFC